VARANGQRRRGEGQVGGRARGAALTPTSPALLSVPFRDGQRPRHGHIWHKILEGRLKFSRIDFRLSVKSNYLVNDIISARLACIN